MVTPSTASLSELADATPSTRDRYVDAIRAFAILVVVLGHWLIATITWDDGGVAAGNALAQVPALQWLTWGFQVMPLFFVVGGFANRASLLAHRRRGEPWATYLRGRTLRLTAPVLPLALVWMAVTPLLERAGLDPALAKVIAQPLWFLAVYLLVSALAPLTLHLHERYGLAVVALLVVATAANDVVGIPFLNYVTVFVAVHQVGYALGDGTLGRLARRHLVVIGAAAVTTLVVLTGPGPYPRSMVGVPGERLSNMSPPTTCILVLAALHLGVVLLVRPVATRALQRRRLWTAVIAVNGSIMTIFLWHLTALAVGAALLLNPASPFPQPVVGTATWWMTRLPWLATMTIVLVALVAAFGRYERRVRAGTASERSAGDAWRPVGPAAISIAALTAFALDGFRGTAAVGAAALLYLMRRMLIGYR